MHYCFFSTGTWEKNASMVRVRELGREMIARGIDVTYAVDDYPYNRQHLNVDPKARINYNAALGLFSQVPARRKVLRRLKPDFVHILNPAPKTMAGLFATRHRVIADWDEWPAKRPNPYPGKFLDLFNDRWLRRRAALNVVASQFMQREFALRYQVQALYLPYAAYLPDHPPTASPFTVPTFVYMGNLFPAYDHDLIFEAAVLLKQQGRTPAMIFLGDGPDIEKWRAFVRDKGLNNLQIPGFTTGLELWRRLRHAHVLLFPIRDTILNVARCPSKTFAYAQARRPVITNRVGEVPVVLGNQASYVEPTPQAFAAAIAHAMDHDQPDVDYGVEAHNWGDRAEKLIAALQRLP